MINIPDDYIRTLGHHAGGTFGKTEIGPRIDIILYHAIKEKGLRMGRNKQDLTLEGITEYSKARPSSIKNAMSLCAYMLKGHLKEKIRSARKTLRRLYGKQKSGILEEDERKKVNKLEEIVEEDERKLKIFNDAYSNARRIFNPEYRRDSHDFIKGTNYKDYLNP